MRTYKHGDIKQIDETNRLVYILLKDGSHKWRLETIQSYFLFWKDWFPYEVTVSYSYACYYSFTAEFYFIDDARKFIESDYENYLLTV